MQYPRGQTDLFGSFVPRLRTVIDRTPSWSGIGTLDNSDPILPEAFVFWVTGDVTNLDITLTFALVGIAPRI